MLAALSLLALALALWLTAPSTPVHADSSPAGRPLHVVCVSSWSPPRGKHRIKPRRCTLHVRGAFPIAGYNTQIFTKLRWKRWGPRKAKAKGKLLVSTVGPVKAKLELRKPRFRCGEWVFTVARVSTKMRRPDGKVVRRKAKFRPDNCVPLRGRR